MSEKDKARTDAKTSQPSKPQGATQDENLGAIAGGKMSDHKLGSVAGGKASDDDLGGVAGGRAPEQPKL